MSKYSKANILRLTNEPYYNRTFKFLGPQINRILSEGQLRLFDQIECITFAIYDENNPVDEFALHYIFKPEAINYSILTKTEYYIRDYPINEELHCIVYRFPIDNIKEFILGDYTKMYTQQEIEELFISTIEDESGIEYFSEVYSILVGMEEYTETFIDKINEEFDTDIAITDLKKKELDYPPLLSQEVIDYTYMGKSNELKDFILQTDAIWN